MKVLPRHWADCISTDFSELDPLHTVAVLPLGATEQHGPHLPLSVDTDLVNGVLPASLPHLPAALPVLFLPTQTVGFRPEHARFAGTLTLQSATIVRLWTGIGAVGRGQRRAQTGVAERPWRSGQRDGSGGA